MSENAYHRRRNERLLKQQKNRQVLKENNLIEIDHLQRAYEDAWLALYKVPCRVAYEHGWYYVHARKIRQSILIGLTNQLLAKVHEQELSYEPR